MSQTLTLLSLGIVLYAGLALWLGRRSVSMPMVFVVIGFALGTSTAADLPAQMAEGIRAVTQITLALLLFADASTLNLRQVREDAQLPLRLLTIGLLLTIFLGTAVALGLFADEGLAFAALLGATLAPTDAALGLPIFNNAEVPVRVRRALNVESGLNDGIAAPFVALFLAFATATEEHTGSGWLGEALSEIALGVVVGAIVGIVGGWFLTQMTRRGWTAGGTEQIAVLGLALAAYFGGLTVGGNGFIAAFVGGIVFGSATHTRFHEPTEFTETFSTFLSLLVWAIFGAVLLPVAFAFTSDPRPILYAILSLTLARMLPVGLALIGTRSRFDTVAVMGWFGPRGLASVVFTLQAFASLRAAGRPIDTLVACAAWTILLSVVLHGLSAGPVSSWYARRLRSAPGVPVELQEVSELRKRHAAITSMSDLPK